MLRIVRLAAFLCGAFTVLSLASGEDDAEFLTALSKLSPQVEEVITGGDWHRGEEDGRYRLIVRSMGYEHIYYDVYLQWVRISRDPNEDHVIERTVPIKELNGRQSLRFLSRNFVFENKQSKIVLVARARELRGGSNDLGKEDFHNYSKGRFFIYA